ncbi:hypothetical protein BRC75_07450 [Halobacteriales archaeon QH_7_69_31]|nr:MAG: hypothetical protein BRC75_07450 [Halobacteriales archaeon QH_7_69_31]
MVATAGHDPLSPEGESYAERLGEASVDVAHHHSAGLSRILLADRRPAGRGGRHGGGSGGVP